MNLESIKICIQSKLETLLGEDLPRQGIIAGEGLAVLVLSSLWGREISVKRLDLYKDWPDEAVEVHGPIHYSRGLSMILCKWIFRFFIKQAFCLQT
jgi:hypothetical protein